MQKHFLSLVLVVLFAIGTLAVESRRSPIRSELRRTNGQLELTKLLNDVLQRTQEQIKPFDSTETQHMAVQKSRVEMFEIYDELKQKRCREESTKKGKDKAIRDAAKILAEHIVQLDELDMHNGCFTNEIVFPSVVYE